MASVEIQNVRKSYGALETIKGVSVDVPDGEFVVLVGPSGCGKSTLLRMIAGLEDISEGTIRIAGKVINDVEPKHRDIAMVFQNYALYPHMTIAENMAFSLRLAKRPKSEIETRVADVAGILGLSEYLERFPKQLSGGQRQRVAMGRAIVRDPKVFLFDEPLSNLDAKLRVQMRAELKELHARLKTTTIYVTHDQIEAMTMADKIVVMRNGVIEQIGSPLDIYDRPANAFVASFIGSPSMNLLPARIKDGAVVLFDGRVKLALTQPISDSNAVTCGVRPEHVTLAENNGFQVVVRNIEPTGSETLMQGTVGDQILSVLIRQRVRLKAGETISLSLDPQYLHIFDSQTGVRLA